MKKYISKVLGACVAIALTTQCSDPWDDRINEGTGPVNEQLLSRLEADPQVSVFLGLLKSSGINDLLDGSNSYTIFAPNSESLQPLVAGLQENPDELLDFVRNHIAVSTHRMNPSTTDTVKLTMLNGKILDLVNAEVGGVAFAKADQGGSDGLYHVLNGPLMPQQNLWEFINNRTELLQNQFIAELSDYRLFGLEMHPDSAEKYGNNQFLSDLADVREESERFTYFVLVNDAFEAEVNQFLPYVNYRNEADSSLQITRYYIVRDLIFDQAYSEENLPEELTSISGVVFPVDKEAITESVQLSNGYVHFLATSSLPVSNKLLDVVIEGEEWDGISESVNASTFVRERADPSGNFFKDLMIQNHGVSSLTVSYRLPYLLSTNYDVYWRALNDIQSNVFQQQVVMAELETEDEEGNLFRPVIHSFPYTDVELVNYDEVYLGEFESAEFQETWAMLVGDATTSNGNNTIVLDYLRLVPKVR